MATFSDDGLPSVEPVYQEQRADETRLDPVRVDRDGPTTYIRLGEAPRRVVVTSRDEAITFFDYYHYWPEMDFSFLPNGEYRVRDARPGQNWRTFELTVTPQEICASSEPGMLCNWERRELLHFQGTFPQRVRIIEHAGQTVVFDHWIYGPALDISFLPKGRFDIYHAPSGRPYLRSELITDWESPSQRVFIQQIDDETAEFDWGQLGSHPSIDLRIAPHGKPVFEGWHYWPNLRIRLKPGPVEVAFAFPSEKRYFHTFPRLMIAPRIVELEGELPRRIRVVDPFTMETRVDAWLYA